MSNQFQIVEKGSDKSDSVYYLRTKIFGISLYKWSYINFTGSFLGTLLIIGNVMCYAFVSNGVSLLIHAVSLVLAYNIGRKKYDSIYEAENEIKKYVIEQTTLQKKKSKNLLKKSNVLNYNIDLDKGIFEKEFHSRTEK